LGALEAISMLKRYNTLDPCTMFISSPDLCSWQDFHHLLKKVDLVILYSMYTLAQTSYLLYMMSHIFETISYGSRGYVNVGTSCVFHFETNLNLLAWIYRTGLVSSQKGLWRLLCLHQRSLHDLELAAWEGEPLCYRINSPCSNHCMTLICWVYVSHFEKYAVA
jgi:hypothetical protein